MSGEADEDLDPGRLFHHLPRFRSLSGDPEYGAVRHDVVDYASPNGLAAEPDFNVSSNGPLPLRFEEKVQFFAFLYLDRRTGPPGLRVVLF